MSVTQSNTEVSNRGRHFRSSRPERITIGDEELVRNDLIAKELGTSERTVNRGDADGAPYILVGGVKFRPIRQYREWLMGRIQVHGQPPKRRRRPGR